MKSPANIRRTSSRALLLSACIALLSVACGTKKEEVAAPEGMHTLDLRRYGKPFAIFVPDTTKQKMEITEQSSGALEIRVGKNFAISILEQASDITMKKQDIKDDEVNKLTSFITDEPDAIMWESAITEPEFHFLINKKVGGSEYSFEEARNPENPPFKKEAIQKMFDSCRNISELKPEGHA